MSAPVDSLSIKVDASARGANQQLDQLVKRMVELRSTVNGINVGNLNNMATSIQNFSKAATGLNQVKTSDFTRMAKSIEELSNIRKGELNRAATAITNISKALSGIGNVSEGASKIAELANGIKGIEEIDGEKLQSISTGLRPLAEAIGLFNGVNFDNKNLSSFINSIARLAKADLGGLAGADFTRIGNSIAGLANTLSGADGISRNVTSFISAIARLANVGEKASVTAGSLPVLGQELRKLVTVMSTVPQVSAETISLTDSIAKLANAGVKAETTAKHLDSLAERTRNFIQVLSTAPSVSAGTIQLVTAIGNLANAGRSANGALNNLNGFASGTSSALKKFTTAVKGVVPSINSAMHSNRNFAVSLGVLYAKLSIGIRVFKKFWDSIDSSMDYIETYNYFQAGFGQVAKNADLSQWKELGYKSAREYAESFQNEAEKLTAKMTGFNVGDNGELTSTGLPSLGLDPDKLMNYQAMFAQMSSSMGVVSGTATNLSRVLTEIGADLASVKNIDFKSAWEDMASGITGMSRTWDKYGVNIRNANLQQKLNELGIKANINALGQNDKALLRTIVLLESTKYAWGDMAGTINQPANQLRLLKNNFSSISREIGNIFLPIVAKTLPYLNAFAIAVRRLVEYVGSLLGVNADLFKNTGGDNSGISDLLDDAENASSAVDDTTDSVKKLAKQLMGFDELNVITTSKSENKDDDEDSGAKVTNALTSALEDAMSDYQKVWNKKFKEMQNDAEKFANKLTNLFKNAWNSGNGSDIGSAIASWLNKGIKWVNDNSATFAAGLKKIANMLATGVNGFVETLEWAGLGTAIGTSLKAFFDAETHFFDTVNWTNFGSSLATSANAAISTGVIQAYIKLIASKLKAAIETAFGAVTTFKFDNLGTAIGQGINDFFDKMGEVNKETGLNGWEELGVTISESITGLATSIRTAIQTLDPADIGTAIGDVFKKIKFKDIGIELSDMADAILIYITNAIEDIPWGDIGQDIADFIKGIKWGKLTWDLVKLANAAFNAIVDAVIGFTETAPLESAVIGLFAALKLTGLGSKMATAINRALLTQGVTLSQVAITIAGVVIAAKAGFSIGKEIGTWIQNNTSSEDMGEYRYNFKFSDLFSYSPSEWAKGFKDWWSDIDPVGTIKELMKDITNGDFKFKIPFTDIELPSTADTTKKILGYIGMLGTFAFTLYATVREKAEGALNKLKETWESVKSKTAELVADAKEKAEGTLAKLRETWDGIKNSTVVKTLQQAGKDTIDKVKASWDAIKSGKAIKTLAQSGKSIIDSAKKSWDAIKSGKATKTMKQKGKDVISAAAKVWDKIKNSEVTKTLKQKGQSVLDKVKKAWDSLQSKKITISLVLDAVKSGIKLIIDWINKYIIGAINKISVKIPSWVPKMGGKTFGFDLKKISIPAFESGGFPQQGQYFLARENGPELVGTIGGKTAVANNAQIVQSVSDGIFNVMAPVLTQVVNSVNALNAKIDNMGGSGVDVEKYTEGDLLKVVRKEDSSYRKRTGKSAFAY